MELLAAVDLREVEVVDNHCHPIDSATDRLNVEEWRSRFTESPDPVMRRDDVVHTALYQRLLRRTADFLGVPPDEEAVLVARTALGTEALVAKMFADARIASVLVDGGYPPTAVSLGGAEMSRIAGVASAGLLRLETLFEELVMVHPGFDGLVEDLRARMADLRRDGFAGLKSIIGYRGGLEIGRWSDDQAAASFLVARREAASGGAVHLDGRHRPLLEWLLHLALAAAAGQELPIQFHIGYGDPDVDLRTATPLHLRALLEDPAYRGLPIVLLHGCWPFFREGAFLAAVYPNAYLDLSYGIPFLGMSELRRMTDAALASAPWSKLLYSSDGARVPELHWLSAHDGRAVLGQALDRMVADGELDRDGAVEVGRAILADNAARLYRVAARRLGATG